MDKTQRKESQAPKRGILICLPPRITTNEVQMEAREQLTFEIRIDAKLDQLLKLLNESSEQSKGIKVESATKPSWRTHNQNNNRNTQQQIDLIEKINKIEQYGTVDEYFERFEQLKTLLSYVAPNTDKNYFISSFVGGLKEEIGEKVWLFEPSTLFQAFYMAKIYESRSDLVKVMTNKNTSTYGDDTTNIPTRAEVKEDVDEAEKRTVHPQLTGAQSSTLPFHGSEGKSLHENNEKYFVDSLVPLYTIASVERKVLEEYTVVSSLSDDNSMIYKSGCSEIEHELFDEIHKQNWGLRRGLNVSCIQTHGNFSLLHRTSREGIGVSQSKRFGDTFHMEQESSPKLVLQRYSTPCCVFQELNRLLMTNKDATILNNFSAMYRANSFARNPFDLIPLKNFIDGSNLSMNILNVDMCSNVIDLAFEKRKLGKRLSFQPTAYVCEDVAVYLKNGNKLRIKIIDEVENSQTVTVAVILYEDFDSGLKLNPSSNLQHSSATLSPYFTAKEKLHVEIQNNEFFYKVLQSIQPVEEFSYMCVLKGTRYDWSDVIKQVKEARCYFSKLLPTKIKHYEELHERCPTVENSLLTKKSGSTLSCQTAILEDEDVNGGSNIPIGVVGEYIEQMQMMNEVREIIMIMANKRYEKSSKMNGFVHLRFQTYEQTSTVLLFVTLPFGNFLLLFFYWVFDKNFEERGDVMNLMLSLRTKMSKRDVKHIS